MQEIAQQSKPNLGQSGNGSPSPDSGLELHFETIDRHVHFLRAWPADKDKPVLLYLHGIEGHGLWFKDTAGYLNSRGIGVYALDRRGSGRSTQSRGDINRWQRLLQDVEEAIAFVREREKRQKIFLMANCWGAKLAALASRDDHPTEDQIAGLILSSPAICVKVDVDLKTKLKICWNFLTENLEPIAIPLKPQDFTDNPSYLKFIEEDKLRLRQATGRFFAQSFFLTHEARNSSGHIQLPTLILQAGKDDIVDVEKLKHWFSNLRATDKDLKIYQEIHHSLDFHHDRQQYLKDLEHWIMDHSSEFTCQSRGGET